MKTISMFVILLTVATRLFCQQYEPLFMQWNGEEHYRLKMSTDYMAYQAKEKKLKNIVDTSYIENVLRFAEDSVQHQKHSACINYLVRKGYTNILSKVLEGYEYRLITKPLYSDVLEYLSALTLLHYPETNNLARRLVDTLVSINSTHFDEELLYAIDFLVSNGDYSRYQLFKQTLLRIKYYTETQFMYTLKQFYPHAVPESEVVSILGTLTKNPETEIWQQGIRELSWWYTATGAKEILEQIALEDLSIDKCLYAIDWIIRADKNFNMFQAYERLLKMPLENEKFRHIVYQLEDFNSPYAYALMIDLKNKVTNLEKFDILNISISTYRGPEFFTLDSNVSSSVDSIRSYVLQSNQLIWIGNLGFINTLTMSLTNAKAKLLVGDSVGCFQYVKQFQNAVNIEYRDTLNTTSNFVTVEGWKFLYYNAQYILDRLPKPLAPSLVAALKNSSGTKLNGGTLQYYDASPNGAGWKDAVNNNDGTFSINTTKTSLSLRMTYAYGSQQKNNVSVNSDTVIFQTVNAQVQLRNSNETLLDTGTVQYYAGVWRTFGTTTNGIATKELLASNYSFRMTYGYASIDTVQDLNTNPTVVFKTTNAQVQLKNSLGNLIDQGTVQYYAGAWRTFGTTTNGVVTKELLPTNYSFRMTYAYGSNDKAQNIKTNPTVLFQTVNATVEVKNSQNNPVNNATVTYYSGAWRSFGTTVNGQVTKELLPVNLQFRAKLGTVQVDKTQNLSTNPFVEIQLNVAQ